MPKPSTPTLVRGKVVFPKSSPWSRKGWGPLPYRLIRGEAVPFMVWHPAHSRLFIDVGILSSSNKHKPRELWSRMGKGSTPGELVPPPFQCPVPPTADLPFHWCFYFCLLSCFQPPGQPSPHLRGPCLDGGPCRPVRVSGGQGQPVGASQMGHDPPHVTPEAAAPQ